MVGDLWQTGWKRDFPRIPVDSLCTELHGDEVRHALVVDLSQEGLRIQRPLGGPRTRTIQLEFEVPEIDEVVWAVGEIKFDEIWRLPPSPDGSLSGVVRTSGIQLVTAASRSQRMLEEYVTETWRKIEAADDWMMRAACYLRG
jgi:hypothetical protein